MESLTPAYIATLLTVGDIHRKIGRSREAIYKAISRMGINSILAFPHHLYDPSVVQQIETGMRKMNRRKEVAS